MAQLYMVVDRTCQYSVEEIQNLLDNPHKRGGIEVIEIDLGDFDGF